MRDGLGLGYPAMQAAFAEWNRGELNSYLIEITADILGKTRSRDRPADGRGDPRSGRAEGHRRLGGHGRARARRAGADHRRGGRRALALGAQGRAGRGSDAPGRTRSGRAGRTCRWIELRDALLAAKLCAYAQGFAVMAGGRATRTAGRSTSARSPASGAAAASSGRAFSTGSRRPTTAIPGSRTCCSTPRSPS